MEEHDCRYSVQMDYRHCLAVLIRTKGLLSPAITIDKSNHDTPEPFLFTFTLPSPSYTIHICYTHTPSLSLSLSHSLLGAHQDDVAAVRSSGLTGTDSMTTTGMDELDNKQYKQYQSQRQSFLPFLYLIRAFRSGPVAYRALSMLCGVISHSYIRLKLSAGMQVLFSSGLIFSSFFCFYYIGREIGYHNVQCQCQCQWQCECHRQCRRSPGPDGLSERITSESEHAECIRTVCSGLQRKERLNSTNRNNELDRSRLWQRPLA